MWDTEKTGMMLGQRLRRWPSIIPALGQRLVFAGHNVYFLKSTLIELNIEIIIIIF